MSIQIIYDTSDYLAPTNREFSVCLCRSWQEEGEGHATGNDDGRHDGCGGNGPDGDEDYRPDGR